ncbi:chromosome partitioning protein [Catalinimonas alkaloidigena]|uniref:Chromosome partitioning protein n=1 Tax=Catalinimonas alkaloidigena TaxID=1075417 RepID=A0A1G9UXS8_9BACT|nr:ParA family protein [Catalinimonas alkaloidigena]SDM64616.1 chromosome partitioning protein [Catalinimonas alkaloidigena]
MVDIKENEGNIVSNRDSINLKNVEKVAMRKNQVIAISNNKGGVGKTTTALNIGGGFAHLGLKVLLIDLDGQANLSSSLGVPPDLHPHVGHVMLEEARIQDVIQTRGSVDILPSAFELVNQVDRIKNEVGANLLLDNALKPMRKRYDRILIDCPPSLDILTLNALTAADAYIVPMMAEFYSHLALDKMIRSVDKLRSRGANPDLQLAGVLFTRHSKAGRTLIGRQIVESTRQAIKDHVFQNVIRDNVALVECVSAHQTIFEYDGESAGAKDYMKICKEILENEES